MFRQEEPFRKVEVTPYEIWAAKCIAAEIAKLTIRWSVTAVARASAGVHGRDKGIWIEPLDRAGLRDSRNGFVFIEWDTGNERWQIAAHCLDDAVSICGIRRAQDGKWNAAMPKDGSRDLPTIEGVGERPIL